MNQKKCPVYAFLRAARGNWRNALVIVCQSCPYENSPICEGHLFVTDALGRPVLFPLEDMHCITGRQIDILECAGILDRHAFEAAYGLYLQWQTEKSVECPIKQLCQDIDLTSCVLTQRKQNPMEVNK